MEYEKSSSTLAVDLMSPPTSGCAPAGNPCADAQAPPPDPTDDVERALDEPTAIESVFDRLPGWLSSAVVHLTALVCLALFVVPERAELMSRLALAPGDDDGGGLDGGTQGIGDEAGEPRDGDPAASDAADRALLQPRLLDESALNADQVEATPISDSPRIRLALDAQPAQDQVALTNSARSDLKEFGDEMMARGGVPGGKGETLGSSFSGRMSTSGRAGLLRKEGGTSESEQAVLKALHWLAEHQSADGGWNFDHTHCPKCKNRCSDPGHMAQARNAATALALLPFLGNGQTQKQGNYKKTVHAGLYFLIRSMRQRGAVGDWHEPGGRMYAHGLAAIVFCEAYGMTHDPALFKSGQASLNYICQSQDPSGGGWRYQPGQPGDTSVVGWQLMALRSGQMAYMQVPKETLTQTSNFLDYVQADSGAAYGYTDSGRRPATSAIGLLCRMYLGWKHDNATLGRGVQMISDWGPSIDKQGPGHQINNLYYDYYATQVMHHYGGYPWKKWNDVMRDYLVRTQAMSGHEQGSWFLEGTDHGTGAGGRLYCTTMAAMILEVYYRHMPLYKERTTKDDFVGAAQKLARSVGEPTEVNRRDHS